MAITEADLTACYRRVHRPLHNVLMRLLWEPGACQDVAHDAFLKVWHRAESVNPATLDALVYATALNLAKNRLRWQGLRRMVGMEFAESVAADDGSAGDPPALRQAIARLPIAQRVVVLMSDIAGFSTAEIAAILGVPAGTVGSRRHHALRRLRELMDEDHA